MTSLFCMKLFCDVSRLVTPERTTFLCLVSVLPLHPNPKMFCWLINSGSLQTSSYDGLSGQELVTEPDLTSAFVSAWPLSWLFNERWRNEPLKNPSEPALPFPALPLVSWRTAMTPTFFVSINTSQSQWRAHIYICLSCFYWGSEMRVTTIQGKGLDTNIKKYCYT